MRSFCALTVGLALGSKPAALAALALSRVACGGPRATVAKGGPAPSATSQGGILLYRYQEKGKKIGEALLLRVKKR
jgi:hypothetical protein